MHCRYIVLCILIPNLAYANCEEKINKMHDGASMKEALFCIYKAKESTTGGVGKLPIGTILSSMLNPSTFEKQYGRSWILADGSRLATTSKYFEITGSDRVPDLRGVFLRGVNGVRADGKGDPKGESRSAGSYQEFSTALPINPFKGNTAVTGEHAHTYDRARPFNSGAGGHQRAKSSGQQSTTAASGKHSHAFSVTSGGDSETRPRNVSVYFYIKVE